MEVFVLGDKRISVHFHLLLLFEVMRDNIFMIRYLLNAFLCAVCDNFPLKNVHTNKIQFWFLQKSCLNVKLLHFVSMMTMSELFIYITCREYTNTIYIYIIRRRTVEPR